MSKRRCPTPRKSAYDSQGAAQRRLDDLRHHFPKAARDEEVYKCPCGRWHFGSAAAFARVEARRRRQRGVS